MTGWHPQLPDGGLPPDENDPGNPSQAFAPTTSPTFVAPTYYGNGCDVRLRPHVLNSLISENLSLLDRVGLAYNPARLWNTRTAVEYIVQRGLPKWVILHPQGSPSFFYTGTLDPPVHSLNNGMVLTVLPTEANRGWVRIDVGNGWWAPVLRDDYQELERGDWDAHIPQLIGYYEGAFYMLGICKSQVPLVLKGTIQFWIRWDGNDENDGTENSPNHAFRTIDGAWFAVGNRFAGSPGAHIALRLGIPGDYEGGTLGPFGSTVSLTGDNNNPAAYRIHTKVRYGPQVGPGSPTSGPPFTAWSIFSGGINSFGLQGVNLVMDVAHGTANGVQVWRNSGGSYGGMRDVHFTLEASNPDCALILSETGTMTETYGRNRVNGNNQTIQCGYFGTWSSVYPGQGGGADPAVSEMIWENVNFNWAGYVLGDNSLITHWNTRVGNFNTTGSRYWVNGFSILYQWNQPIPGNAPGWAKNSLIDTGDGNTAVWVT